MFERSKEASKTFTLEEVCKAYENLSEDDKKAFQRSITDRMQENTALQDRENGQEDSQGDEAQEPETSEEEHADDGGEVSELHGEEDTVEEQTEGVSDEEQTEEAIEDNSKAEDNRDEIIKSLTDRISALEESFADFGALKEKMDEYTRKQAESFGLPGKVIGGSSKNMEDMSASELKNAILSGQK